MARKWWTLVAVCTATFMLLLDITIVNVALPPIQRALTASFSQLQWVVDAYALALATCVLTAGALADLFGRKRLFLLGIVLFTAASAACGAAFDPLFLIVARGVQGIGGAMMFATALALLSQEFHGKERGTAFGLWGAVIGAAVAIGPLAGGMLTTWISWRWIFFVNIPIGFAAVALGLRQVHESKDPEHSRLDPVGLVTLTAGLLCLILALIEGNGHGWSSAFIVALLAAAAVVLTAFLVSRPQHDGRPGALPAAGVRRGAGDGVRNRVLDVLDVPVPDAVHAGCPPPLGARDRRSLPAAVGARVLRGAARGTVEQPRPDSRPDRSRTGAERDRDVVDEPRHDGLPLDGAAARLPDRRHRHRARQRAPRDDRSLHRPRGAGRDGLGDQQHVPPDRHRHRHRRPRRDLLGEDGQRPDAGGLRARPAQHPARWCVRGGRGRGRRGRADPAARLRRVRAAAGGRGYASFSRSIWLTAAPSARPAI